MSDLTMDALQSMLRGLAERQRVISDNIANIETPGFIARRVEFEDALTAAIKGGGDANVAPKVLRTNDAALPNGNNVQVDKEVVALQDTQLRYQLAIEAMTAKLNLIRSSMRSSL